MHPFLADQIAATRLADLRADATQRRIIRNLRPSRRRRFWRRPRPEPHASVMVVEIPRRDSDDVDQPDAALRPVA